HGDSAIYDALVRMAQGWVMRVPLVHGQGNFGSVDGDPPAAYRYTEAKLAAAADYLMRELRQETVDLRPTYNSETQEPVVLPAEFPNLLINGAAGIAVGMATNIPPHNPGEVIRSALHLIDDSDASTAVLMDRGVKGPDFPLGGPSAPTCSSTARPASRSAWQPTSHRTTRAKSSPPRCP